MVLKIIKAIKILQIPHTPISPEGDFEITIYDSRISNF
jgi:hypothetical protein